METLGYFGKPELLEEEVSSEASSSSTPVTVKTPSQKLEEKGKTLVHEVLGEWNAFSPVDLPKSGSATVEPVIEKKHRKRYKLTVSDGSYFMIEGKEQLTRTSVTFEMRDCFTNKGSRATVELSCAEYSS